VDGAFIENFAQQAAIAPLHHHINAGALLAAEDAHHFGMVELFADAGFALKTVKEDGIGFQIRMGNFEGNDAVVARVDSAIDGCHAAACDRRHNAVRVDLRGCRLSKKLMVRRAPRGTASMVSGKGREEINVA
jgi:hypothetical protein